MKRFRNFQRTLRFQNSLYSRITRYAMLELPMFFSLFLFLGNGDYRYLLISGTVLTIHLSLRPTKDNVSQTLNLTDLERSEL